MGLDFSEDSFTLLHLDDHFKSMPDHLPEEEQLFKESGQTNIKLLRNLMPKLIEAETFNYEVLELYPTLFDVILLFLEKETFDHSEYYYVSVDLDSTPLALYGCMLQYKILILVDCSIFRQSGRRQRSSEI